MAEPLRKDNQLTTADLAGRKDDLRPAPGEVREIDEPNRPMPVRSESVVQRTEDRVANAADRSEHKISNAAERTDQKFGNAADRAEQRIVPGAPNPSAHDVNASAPLFSQTDVGDLRGRWGNVQASFVDEPRKAVEEADKLVAAVMQRLAEGFANERSKLEKQWDRGDNVSTEDLRIALQRYRSFFDRLLNA